MGLYDLVRRPGGLIENADVLRAGPGSNGEVVGEIQGLLNFWGAQPQLELDNVYGPLTTKAVRDFQQANELAVDGVVGPETSRALQDSDSKSVGAKVSPTKVNHTLRNLALVSAGGAGVYFGGRAVMRHVEKRRKQARG